MKKQPVTTVLAICVLLLLLFYVLNIAVLFVLLNIARIVSLSFDTPSTRTPGVYTRAYIEEKPWNKVWESPEPTWSITCDTAHFEYDLCYLNRRTVVDPTTAIVSAVDPTNSTPAIERKIRPYPRKGQPEAMEKTKELTLTTFPAKVSCQVSHSAPALIFSAGGFTGNVFHDFNEGWVPLFITVDEHFVDRDVILAIVNCSEWWMIKYAELFPKFSRYPIINLDKETTSHCFPRAIVGLKSHGVMIVDPTLQRGPHPKTMMDFQAVITDAYESSLRSHGFSNGEERLPNFSPSSGRPRMALLNRQDTRRLLNTEQLRRAAEEVGFEVAVFEVTPKTPMRELYRVISRSHALAGVHGAALTHELFLRPGAVLLQIVPINTGWLADMCYGKLASRLGLEYVVYEAGIEESTLQSDAFAVKQHMDPHDPASTLMGNLTNWYRYMNQHVEVDTVRFKRYLNRAYEKAIVFMHKQQQSSVLSAS
ncbi:xylan glycosyltransferase MUCI21-like [Diospyros lotus]|uniref:xylan glycosyltransferase MUCI21-like n=1 Tax=Diospyros lotus TaxID=55363 RepID=UPI0022507863|nr:xylan glycosyltransferase MUCI21-like [Diospyros lotus]